MCLEIRTYYVLQYQTKRIILPHKLPHQPPILLPTKPPANGILRAGKLVRKSFRHLTRPVQTILPVIGIFLLNRIQRAFDMRHR